MLKNEREQEILTVLQSTGYATVKFLSEELYTSESCVRRALTGLTEKGLVRRSYGGVELLRSHTNVTSFGARAHQNAAAKQAIAKKSRPPGRRRQYRVFGRLFHIFLFGRPAAQQNRADGSYQQYRNSEPIGPG